VCAESSSTKQQQQGFLTLEIEPQTSEKREKTHIQRQKKKKRKIMGKKVKWQKAKMHKRQQQRT